MKTTLNPAGTSARQPRHSPSARLRAVGFHPSIRIPRVLLLALLLAASAACAEAQWSVERVLRDIVDPNAEIDDEHASYVVETVDGEVHTGLLAESADGGVALRLAGDTLVELPAERVRDVRSSDLSMMPEGLAAGLDVVDMADLLAFLNR